MLIPRHFRLNRTKMLGFLQTLESAADDSVSVYLPARSSKEEIETMLPGATKNNLTLPDLSGLILPSITGAALFWGPQHKYLVIPPFPLTVKYITHGFDTEPLLSLLHRDFTVALVLVRLGAYAVGVTTGEKLIESKVGTGLVHGRHRQGGSSSKRFARRRVGQIDNFLERVGEKVLEKIQPHEKEIDYVAYGGARTTIISLQKECPFLYKFDERTLPPMLEIPEPNQAVLENAIELVWSSKITEFREIQD